MATKTYIEDIHTLFTMGDAPVTELYESFSWGENDKLVRFRRIPMVRITSELLTKAEEGKLRIPSDILEIVRDANISADSFTFAFIATDLERSLVIAADKKGVITHKGRVDCRSAYRATMQAQGARLKNFVWDAEEIKVSNAREDILLTEDEIIGLTRREQIMKDMLLKELSKIFSCTLEEAKFWHEELFPECAEGRDTEYRIDIVNEMVDFLRLGWSKRHEEFGTSFIRARSSEYKRWRKMVNINQDFVVVLPE